MTTNRTPPKKKARELAKYFRAERVDYPYLISNPDDRYTFSLGNRLKKDTVINRI